VQIILKIGLVVGNGGYYSKASGKKWVTPHKTNNQPLPLKNNPKRKAKRARDTLSQWIISNESLMTSTG
jgi:hypothetical protein